MKGVSILDSRFSIAERRENPKSKIRRAFTLLEVMVALAIFALAAVVLASAYLNILLGYEIAANASGITPAKALELWQKSSAHHAVMINQGIWKKPWGALGVAINGDYAVAWFGEQADN